jgi:hypothetical protein
VVVHGTGNRHRQRVKGTANLVPKLRSYLPINQMLHALKWVSPLTASEQGL